MVPKSTVYMKSLKFRLLCVAALFCAAANAQLEITASTGLSSYYGDLTENAKIFNQPSFAFNSGVSYQFSPKFSWRSEIGFAMIQAKDSKNSRADLRARNLSFKNNIWNLNTAIEYDFVNMAEHRFSPYVFLGIGLCRFNPYTTDRNGQKQFLQPLGTEGQGTSAYPDRKLYKRTELEVPMGFGAKYAINDHLILGFEFKYHYVDTDYLDDVSMGGYPDKTVLSASTAQLAYRGDELPGGASYPAKGTGLNRGNPNNRDVYYSTQIKFAYRLNNNKIQINY
jgi:opacity protein-like surface antigen